MFQIRKAALVAAALAIGLGLSSCASNAPGDEQGDQSDLTPFNMSTQSWIGYAPWYIAQEQGYFADRGLDVTITTIDDVSAYLAAMSSGQVDGANISTSVWLTQLSNGVAWDLVMLEDRAEGADAILGGPGIDSLSDLTGESVAYGTFTTSQLLINAAFAKDGLDISSVEHVDLPPDQAGAALIAGQVAAAVTYEPYISSALAQSDDITVLYPASEIPGLISDGFAVDPAFLEQNPEAVVNLTLAWNDAVEFISANPEEALEIMADHLGTPSSDLLAAFEGVAFYTRAESAAELSGSFVEETLQMTADSMLEAGMISSIPEFRDHVTDQFVID